jgi:hypothetical protein
MTDCAGCAEPGNHPHTRDCLFEHFLNYMGFTECSDTEKALMRIAYGHGMDEGVKPRLSPGAQAWVRRRTAMSEPI